MPSGQDKPTKITFVYSNPTDPAAFEAAYPEQLGAEAPRSDPAAGVEGLA